MSLILSTTAFAAESANNNNIDSVYKNVYDECKSVQNKKISDDYGAYSYLLNNLKKVNISDSNIGLSSDIYNNLEINEIAVVKEFVNHLNTLIKEDAILVNSSLKISAKKAPVAESRVILDSQIFEIMPEARAHAKQLKNVYDNAVFGTAHLVAGKYFADRVKTGGVWDYKKYLGLKTRYYESELRATMTGETIGNFHYGYVGSVCFGPTTLKSAAGFIQILSGTTDLSYWDSYFDDPRDQKDIQWGIDKYQAEH